jgi:hypothetical protein
VDARVIWLSRAPPVPLGAVVDGFGRVAVRVAVTRRAEIAVVQRTLAREERERERKRERKGERQRE